MAGRPTTAFAAAAPKRDESRYSVQAENMATIVIFGATGDLASRKLISAVYNLWTSGFLPRQIAVVGVARRPKTDDEFRQDMCEALKKYSRTGHGDSDTCDPFVGNLFYYQNDFVNNRDYSGLKARLEEIEAQRNLPGNRLYYLATAPEFFAPVVRDMGAAGLVNPPDNEKYTRVIFEKPFGHDLESARELNAETSKVLSEDQVFRIDHYLGKETVQNIFAFRFGNSIFEPLFNQKYIDHVQITVAETVGMEGRGDFYDQTGALRDVIQNHAVQLMCLVAMEPPARFSAKEIRDEKVKVLSSVRTPDADDTRWYVRGQYAEGAGIPGFLSEEGVAGNSTTETYVALKLFIDNWRWAGVPFFIRTGKRLAERVTEIVIQFNDPPKHYFQDLGVSMPQANTLVFRIQPDEAISLTFSAKPPGMEFDILPVNMDFRYGSAFGQELPEAYERLILDALRGDSTLFMRSDEIEKAWGIMTQILNAWQDAPAPELYRPATWGPAEANTLMECCRGEWRKPRVEPGT